MPDATTLFTSYQERDFIPPHLLVADSTTPFGSSLAEKDLHDFWGNLLPGFAVLQSTSGERIEIIHPGKYNQDAGPDFRRATIKIQDRIIHGDVELHLDSRDWFQHGHHADPAYNEVILHVALRNTSPLIDIVRENSLPVTQVLLDAHDLPAREPALRWVAECPLARTAPEKILATVRRAGQFRLEQKATAFGELLVQNSWDQAVHLGIAEALGYNKNQEAFRLLAKILPADLLFAELRSRHAKEEVVVLEALLFGAAGFLDGNVESADAEVRAYLAPRKKIWRHLSHTLRLPALPPTVWRFFRLRPANFPTRRIAGLAAILRRASQRGVLEHMLKLAQNEKASPRKRCQEIINFFIIPAEGFWERRCDFQSRPAGLPAPNYGDLVGSARALDIVVNVIMPALLQYAGHAGDARLMAMISELYSCLPSPQSNLLTRRMAEQLSQEFALHKQLSRGAPMQQGLIYLQKLLCRPLRCETCLKFARTGEPIA